MHSIDQYFQTGGARIHGRVWENPNSAAIPLVILHGIWESWRTFADVAPRFAQKRSVYALDLRGHGESDKPEQGYSLSDYAADIESVLKQLPYSHIHLLGHSLGSLVAIQLAGKASTSTLLEKLILQDPPFVMPHQKTEVKNDMQHLLELKRQPLEAVVAEFTSQPSPLARAWFEMTARDFLQSADGPFLALMNNELTTETWATLLSRITTPTLFLAADPADGGWMGEASHALVRSTLPTAQIVDFPGCGHHIEATCTESFMATVEEFLDKPVQKEKTTTSSPLAGWGGKPLLGSESSEYHFVGRVILELYEGPHISSDANGLVFSINPGIGTDIDPETLLKRVAEALPIRIPKLADQFERQRQKEKEMGGL